MMVKHDNKFNFLIASILSGLLFYSSAPGSATLTLSQTPLLLGGVVDPNVIFTLDDSGSMRRELMPGGLGPFDHLFPIAIGIYGPDEFPNRIPLFDGDTGTTLRSITKNKVFYNPAVTYIPWSQPDGSLYADADVSCAPHNPFLPLLGCRDFTQENTEIADWIAEDGTAQLDTAITFWPATYFNYVAGSIHLASSYDRIEIRAGNSYTTSLARTDCTAAPDCTFDEELQNFANWYSYYRSRIFTSRASIGRAFAQQGANIRVGFASINNTASTVDGVASPGTLISGVRIFEGTDREAFFNQLYGLEIPIVATPLRQAVDDIGIYYERQDDRGPWGQIPGTNDSTPQLECRRSYNVLMTDSFGDGDPARTVAAQANVDQNNGPTITDATGTRSYTYSPVLPFQDSFANTIADVAMYYWYRDLRPDLENRVPTSSVNPAFWQHMVNYTVTLGVVGTLDPAVDLPALTDGSKTWPDPTPLGAQLAKTDDLWHAAVNSRGEFLNAFNADSLSASFSGILSAISNLTGSSSSPALNSGTIGSQTHLYQARYDSSDWTGQLLAFPIASDGSLGAALWDAGSAITGQNFESREILTFDPVSRTGIPFKDDSLNASQRAALDINPVTFVDDDRAEDRLEYLRGKTEKEQRNGGIFRNRTSVLGDVVHSAPAFVGRPNSVYPSVWDDLTIDGDSPPEETIPGTYSIFQSTHQQRQRVVYFGSNDGFLHGVDAGSFDVGSQAFTDGNGTELIAYVPAALFGKLNRLTDPAYDHEFFVDATPTVAEAFYGGDWHTVLSTGYGAGGQGIMALDVTDPGSFDENNAANLVLWEFTDADDADLGNNFGQPVNIVRLHNGQWAAIFGNGYNNTEADGRMSTTGNAVLYIVDIATGNLIKKIDTLKGMAQDPAGLGRPNGLSAPAPVDRDGDFIVDVVVAGDLYGNLWKFNLVSADPNQWSIEYGGQPLFTATDAGGNAQPITVRPQVGRAPEPAGSISVDPDTGQFITDATTGEYVVDAANGEPLNGSIIYFGTGQFFEVGDTIPLGQTTQTFYAVWDKQIPFGDADVSVPPFNRTHLLSQQIFQEFNANDADNPFDVDLRVTTNHEILWHSCAGLPPSICDLTPDTDGNLVADYLGWKMDLINVEDGNTFNAGERIVSAPILRAGRIIFTTLVPDLDPCNSGSTGWLMEVEAESGSRLTLSPFDLNGDLLFNGNDFVAISVGGGATESIPVSGKRSTVGVISTPAILSGSDQRIEYKYTSGSSGNIETTVENAAGSVGRLSWQQLFD